MLQTIEVQIDSNGYIHSLEPIQKLPIGRAFVTLLENPITLSEPEIKAEQTFDNLFGILTASHSVSLEDMEQSDYINDDDYLKSINGMVQSINEARNEPIANGVTLDNLDW